MSNKNGICHNRGKKCYNNGIKNIYLSENDEVPEGFVLGALSKGRKCYTDGVQNIYLKADDIPQLVDEDLPQQLLVSAFRRYRRWVICKE